MTETPDPETLWRMIFQDGHPFLLRKHRMHHFLPSPPRCRLCHVPFAGLGGWIMRRRGHAPTPRNPNYCAACNGFIDANPGGAEVTMPVLFVDIRQSSAAARSQSPRDFAMRINRFFDRVTATLADLDGFIVEFRGDCVAAVFPPGFLGPDAARKAVAAAAALARLPEEDALRFGVGVHAGMLYIGTVGAAGDRVESVTVLGDVPNMAAALAQTAEGGQALASGDVLTMAGDAREVASMPLKGRDVGITAALL